jgi:hypothetical protein
VTPLWVARTLLGLVGGSSGDAGEAERSVGGEGRSYERKIKEGRWNGSVPGAGRVDASSKGDGPVWEGVSGCPGGKLETRFGISLGKMPAFERNVGSTLSEVVGSKCTAKQ